jgi:hypothetical protein
VDQELVAYFEESFRSLREDVKQVAERIYQHQTVVEGLREDLGLFCGAVLSIEDRLKHFEERSRNEIQTELDGLRRLVSPSYLALDCRIRVLEVNREFQERDPIELIKERFGFGTKPE